MPYPGEDGKVKHRPYHAYTMKQAIQEGFILDVLKSYTPVDSYYKLVKTIEGDPEFDTKRAQKKLRRYVESHDHAIRIKAEIMVDHFHENVIGLNKIGGKARAMLVCSGVERAIQYLHAFREYLRERKSPYQAIVAFSGEHEYEGVKVTESSLNGFPSADALKNAPYVACFVPHPLPPARRIAPVRRQPRLGHQRADARRRHSTGRPVSDGEAIAIEKSADALDEEKGLRRTPPARTDSLDCFRWLRSNLF
jgi:hypothetical protein